MVYKEEFNIGIGELIANAFISYYNKTKGRVLSLRTITEYEQKCIMYLKKLGFLLIIDYSKKEIEKFFEKYSNIFVLTESHLLMFLPPKTSNDLIDEFSARLPYEVILAMRSSETTSVLFGFE